MAYAFTHTDRTRQRLKVLADVYAASTSLFLHECLTNAETPSLAIDLGCGPGYTIHLLANTLQIQQIIGLDLSPDFYETAFSLTLFRPLPTCVFPWTLVE
jgi:trans-aconitate 2-methyltransferase